MTASQHHPHPLFISRTTSVSGMVSHQLLSHGRYGSPVCRQYWDKQDCIDVVGLSSGRGRLGLMVSLYSIALCPAAIVPDRQTTSRGAIPEIHYALQVHGDRRPGIDLGCLHRQCACINGRFACYLPQHRCRSCSDTTSYTADSHGTENKPEVNI